MARPRKENPTDVMCAVATAFVTYEGREVLIREGVTTAHRGSRFYKAFPGFFADIGVHYEVDPPAAEPGAKRGA